MLCFTHLNAPDLWTESGGGARTEIRPLHGPFGPHMLCFTHLNAPDLGTESGGDTDRIWRADGPNRVQRPTHEVGQPDTDRIQGGHGPNPDSVHKVLFFQ